MNHQTTSTMLLKRAAHKGLRGLLVFAQITSALSATIATVAQPAALAPLVGTPNVANASTNQPTPSPIGNGVITVTKSVIGSAQSNFTVNIIGPSYPSGASVPIVSGTQVITGLMNGIYTITEQSPGAGWTTTYTASGVSSSSNTVVTLTNVNTATRFTPSGPITGTVYNDYLSDGNITANGMITDTGVQSVTVSVYDIDGNLVTSTQTAANGRYTITAASLTVQGPYRVEFANLPSGYEPSRVFTGTQNGTSVQFVNADTAVARTLNFGILNPSDYSQAAPPLAVDWFVGGDNDNGTTPTGGVVVFPYAASIATPAFTTLSTRADVGSVWGLAWARQTRKLYAAAFLKRHSGLYEVGGVPLPGAVFEINPDTGAESLWVDLASAPYNVNVGAVASNATRGLGAPTSPNQDGSVYYDIGIKSLGDIDLSEDEQTMYVMSLNDKTIYALDVASKALLDSYPMTGITCTGGQFRPFGLKYYRGQLYAGGVCDASTSGLVADLRGRAYRLESGTFNQILDFSLNYTNGSLYLNSGTCGATSNWHAWISSPTIPGTCVSTGERVYPQPVFSDIEFDTNGDMILGFLDRFGHQTGVDTYLPTSNTNERSIAAGEVFRACRTASGWALESAGDSVAGCLNSFSSGTIGNNNQGLGGGEFYWGLCFGGNNCTNNGSHVESANGGLALQPGRNELLATSMNPAGNAWAGGVMWLSNSTGAKNRGYHIYSNPLTGPAYLHKSHGVGDVELLLDPAPIEIGNRVWNDVNANGVQDPGEPPIAGVVVTLTTPAGTIATTTNVNGTYVFTREATTGAYTTTLRSNTAYTITINPNQTALSGYSLTTANAQAISGSPTSNDAISDTRDSDATTIGGLATIYYTTGAVGENNHGLDFGFSRPATGMVTITNTAPAFIPALFGDRVWIESDSDGLASTGSITPVAGMVITASDGTSTYTVTTTAQGYYSFSVPAGTYTVTYGNMPAGYGPVLPSATPGSGTLTGNSGSYAQSGDPDQSHPQNTVVTVAATEGNWQVDFAFTPQKFDIGNRVWFDTNNDGVLNLGEQPVDSVTMQLRDSAGAVMSTTTTNAQGYYAFTNLMSGTYSVTVAASNFAPGGALAGYWNSSPTTAPSNTASDNDDDHGVNPTGYAAYLSNGVSSGPISAGPGLPTSEDSGAPSTPNGDASNNLTIDFGFYNQQIGNTIWVDTNDNGLLDGAEQPYTAGPITVTLVSNSGTVVSTTVTSNGLYTFTGVPSGTFVVSITVPASYRSSTPTTNTVGVDDNDNGSASGAFIVSAAFTATPGTNVGSIASDNTDGTTLNPSIDFGLVPPPAQFGDRVWIESDTDGLASTGTITPVAGMPITATDGTNVYTKTTNAQGYYSFTVPAGTYTVTYGAVPPSYGTVLPSSTPGGSSESGNSGSYQQSGNPDQSHVNNTTVTVAAGQANWLVDFGFHPVPPAQFGDRVWIESDSDGLASTGSITPVAGLVITATDGVVTYTTTTNAQGYYSFSVPAGTYTVTYGAMPAGYGPVLPSAAPGSATLSGNSGSYAQSGNPDQSHPQNTVVTVAATEGNWQVDFAFTPQKFDIGNRVWFDTNNDGMLNNSEQPVDGVTMQLRDSTGAVIATTTTSASGYYSFTNLMFGTYTVTVAASNFAPGGALASYWNSSPTTAPSNTASDNDDDHGVNPATYAAYLSNGVSSGPISVGPGLPTSEDSGAPSTPNGDASNNLTIDFGFYNQQIGNTIWVDTNDNGLLDGAEQPYTAGPITVTLVSNSGTVVSTTVTSNGLYTFTGVPSGTFVVSITVPASYRSSTPTTNTVGVDDNDNGSASGAFIVSAAFTATPGTNVGSITSDNTDGTDGTTLNPSIDFGLVPPPAQFGDRVWIESDTDGLASTGTITPVAGMPITATDGTNVYTKTTNAQGYYSFTVPAGTYTVTYGAVPPSYGTMLPSSTPGSATLSGNSGSYQQSGNPDVSHPQDTSVTVAAGQANWQVDFAFNPPQASITVKKYTNGFDADTVTGPFVKPGDDITWTYVLTNNGNVTLTNVTLVDSVEGTIPCTPTTLAPGEGTTCEATGIATLGQYTNTAVVTGTPPVGPVVTSTNPSHYFGSEPKIVVKKYTNGFDADTLSDPRALLTPGAAVTWRYVVTNTGNVPLTMTLSDDRISLVGASCAPVSNGQVLATGGTTTCTLSSTAQVTQTTNGIYTNTATVTGVVVMPPGTPTTPTLPGFPPLPPTQPPVTDTNPSHYEVLAQFGDRVWLESDTDGLASTGTITPVAGMVMTATDGVNTYTTTTNAAGYYSFTVSAGTYTVTYGTVPPSYGIVVPSSTPGSNSTSGNAGSYQQSGNPDQSRPQDSTVTVAAGQANWTMDYAFNVKPPVYALGNLVFMDFVDNGVFDPIEDYGIDGVTMTLFADVNNDGVLTAADGAPISETVTAGGGFYRFNDLPAGHYIVIISNTLILEGGITTQFISSLADPLNLNDSATDPDDDVNHDDNGLQEQSSPGVPGRIVSKAITLGPGSEPVNDGDTDPLTNLSLDFGVWDPSLGDLVWYDANRNGIYEPALGETGIPSVTLYLYRDNGSVPGAWDPADGISRTTTTNADGRYFFNFVVPGRYTVRIVPSNTLPSGPLNGLLITPVFDPTPDNNRNEFLDQNGFPDGLGGYVGGVITITNGAEPIDDGDLSQFTNLTYDFAFYQMQLGNQIWYEVDDDGLYEPGSGETPAPGITVTLLDDSGNLISTTVTNASGQYTFTNLVSGTYVLSATRPVGYRSSTPTTLNDGGNNTDHGTDSGPSTGSGFMVSVPFDMTPGGGAGTNESVITQTATTYNRNMDFGMVPPAQFGDRVWIESDSDGLASSGVITPVAGMVIAATDGTNTYTTTTNAAGYYSFTVPPGVYTVTYGSVPASYGYAVPSSTPGGSSTSGNQGSYQQSGNPDQSHTQATVVTVTPGQGNWHVDFGFNAPPSGIAVRKYTNGFDADTVTGPYLKVGDAVTWTYVVSNTGGTAMTVAVGGLTDDVIGAINASQFVLLPGQVQTFTKTGVATLGQYTNIATVTGTPPSGVPTTSTNPSHYFGYAPGIVLKKYTNGFDADAITGPFIKVSDAVTWTYIATNTGNIALSFAIGDLRDDIVGPINATPLTIQPGEVRIFTATGIATVGQYTNTGLITGTPVLPPGTPITPELPGFPLVPPPTSPVTSTNPSHYFGVNPSLVLRKFTNGYDADALPLTCNGALTFNNQACVALGSTITWIYVVTNTGNLTLSIGIGELRDDKEGAINASPITLAAGQAITLSKTGVAQAGQYTNTGVVTGTPVLPPGVPITPELPGFPTAPPITTPVTSTNPSHYFGDTAGLGDFVWEDLDHDGQQDANEPPVQNVLVSLQTPTTTLTATTTITGHYAFAYLVPGVPYTVSFGLPSGYTWTLPTVGNPISDSNVLDNLGNTSQVVLGPNEFNPTIDAGVWRPASLGDYVWEDINHDGQQNDGTTGVNGVTVTLYSNGVPVSQTQTFTFGGVAGYYTFTNLISATYSVTFQAPAGYQFTLADVGGDSADSDANPITGATGNYVLNAGENIPTVDAGIWRPASLGDYVWEDLNHDGQQNDPSTGSGQVTGINGVAVALLNASGSIVSTTNTYQGGPANANGYYTFTNLISGTYSVSFTLPAGYQWTIGNTGNDTTDSDGVVSSPTAATVATQQYVLNAGESNPTVDQGVWRPASLGDVVWYDQNHDGVQQPGEPGVPNVQVSLQTPTGTLTTQTDSTGAYTFTNLLSSVPYTVTFGQSPTGYTFTLPTVGSPISDSNVLNPSGVTAPVVLQPGENNPTIDAGVWVPLELGNYVWIDTNNDGLNNEPASNGVPNVMTVLYADNGDGVLGVGDTQVATTTTDASGHYTFTNLISGTYLVQIPQSNFAGPLVNYQSSTGNGVATTNNNTNNDDDGEPAGALGVTSRPITLTPFAEPLNDDTDDGLTGSTNTNYSVDFGFFQMAAIGDRVWYDVNANGVQDGAEITGVPGVQVSLYGVTNTVIATTTTDANGYYSFTNLLPGDYSVGFALPSGYTRSPSTAGGASDPTDSDADVITGRTDTTTLVSGESDPTWDAGIYQTASLGDRVWEDTNRNGVQDGGEPGVMSVTVTLWQNSVPISTTQTDGTGFYGFANLTPTVPFSVSFGLPLGYVFTLPDVGLDGTDSDADPTTGSTPVLTLQPNETNPTIDAGIWRPAGIGDRVWLDNDRDGVQNVGAGETGVPNVPVTLWQNGNPISNTQTNAQGYYSFTGLIPGAYSLTFGLPIGYARTPQDVLSNGLDAQDSDTTLVNGETISTTLDSNEYDPTWDMGIFQLASLGDKVWEDLDHDGVQDPNEPGVPSVPVVLYDVNNNPVMTTTTDANGNYSFTNLIPATYTVGFVLPPTYLVTTQGSNPSSNNPTDSNADPTTGRTPPVLLVPGENNPTIDAGLWRPASLGDYVWDDTNHDGQQDANEPGVNGLVVALLDVSGNVISTTQTYTFDGTDGYYTFTNLISGTYVVSFTLPQGFTWTQTNLGADGTDSDGAPSDNMAVTQPYVLNAGESIPTVDQGVWQPASLGDRVWWDYDRNGQQATQTDLGVPNVMVRLLDAGGTVISTTVTDARGYYTFSNLISSTYQVAFDLATLPAGTKVTLPNVSGMGKDLFDSDADVNTGRTPFIALLEGEHDPSWDMGIWFPAGLGDFVWEDKDRDGVQEPGEPGVAGVTVKLYDSAGNLISTTVTNASGYYIFSDLVPMTYTVQFVPPSGYQLTLPFVGNPGTDSNADPSTGSTPPIVLAPGQFNPTVDAGLWIPASLGNYVWQDDNTVVGSVGDGIQNEPASRGLNGVTVNLLNASGLLIATQVTHDDPQGNPGYYTFTQLIPSDYGVQFVLPPGAIFTEADASTDNKDSDANVVTGKTVLITLESGENDPTWDAGIIVLAGLGNYVWSDNDRDGIQDANEPAVPGVLVKLYDSDGSVISTTTTDINGFYVFTGLLPGTYSVGFTAPDGFMFTNPVAGADETDSNANPQTGRTTPVVLAPGEYNPTVDAGLVPLSSLGDFVWNDLDRDGMQDPGEQGVPGVTVTLKDGNGQVVATTTTNASGSYSFTNLIPGTYVVIFTIPQGYTFTKPNVGGDGTDSDATPTQADALIGVVPPVTLLPGENNPTIDAGVWVPARLGDFVWYDVNRNGIQDASEAGVKGATVTLYQRGNVLSTTVTATDGRYLFDNLIPGDYYVVFTLPNGFTFTLPSTGSAQSDSNADPLTGQSATTTIEPGEDDRTWDAGIWLPLPALNLRKTVQTSTAAVKQGDLVSYTIVVSNSGPGIANNVVITDPLPSDLLYEAGSARPAAIYANKTLTWTKATLRPGERYTMTFAARVQASNSPTATQIVNLAFTSATGPANVPVQIVTPPLRADDQANVQRAPTAITLASFTARWVTNTVAVQWVTSEEINSFGFVLYRAQVKDLGAAVKLNDELIPARGSNGGAGYSFVDTSVDTSRSDIVYYYWLQEVETNGKINVYGPVKTERETPTKPTKYLVFLPMISKSK